MDENLAPPGSDEEKADLQQQVRLADSVRAWLQHTAWQNIIKPQFDNRIEVLIEGLLHEDDQRKVVRYQEAVNAITAMMNIINSYIQNGDVARKRLAVEDNVP